MSLLNEKEILDYLMSSDFTEGLNEEESRFLLLKFRYHYRLLYTKNESLKHQLENKIEMLQELEKQLDDAKFHTEEAKKSLEQEKDRKLTWQERFWGKKNI